MRIASSCTGNGAGAFDVARFAQYEGLSGGRTGYSRPIQSVGSTRWALLAAINVLRDSAESRKMPNGDPLTDAVVQFHFDAADMLEQSLSELRDHE
jgi:hypothetical protein